jgi:hypothetical protein
MPYTSNPHMPRLRMQAVAMVRSGCSIRQVARHTGFQPSTISRWIARAPDDGRKVIPTGSARPHAHPRALPQRIVDRIVALRLSACARSPSSRISESLGAGLRYGG